MGAEIAFLLIVWVMKNAASDVLHAAKGTENPRYAARKRAKEAAGGRYGFGDWWADFKSDALQERTRLRREKARTKAANRAEPSDEDPQAEGGGRPVEDVPPPPDPVDRLWCPPHKWRGGVAARNDEGQLEQGQWCICGAARVVDIPEPRTEPDRKPDDYPNQDGDPDGTVLPFRRRTEPAQPSTEPEQEQEGTTMPETNTEVVGLDQSIAYAEKLAEVGHNHGLAGNEGYIGQLERAKVVGKTLASGREMQEAFDNAAAVATRHAELLRKQKAIQEQYDVQPDAGDKDFQTTGR